MATPWIITKTGCPFTEVIVALTVLSRQARTPNPLAICARFVITPELPLREIDSMLPMILGYALSIPASAAAFCRVLPLTVSSPRHSKPEQRSKV